MPTKYKIAIVNPSRVPLGSFKEELRKLHEGITVRVATSPNFRVDQRPDVTILWEAAFEQLEEWHSHRAVMGLVVARGKGEFHGLTYSQQARLDLLKRGIVFGATRTELQCEVRLALAKTDVLRTERGW